MLEIWINAVSFHKKQTHLIWIPMSRHIYGALTMPMQSAQRYWYTIGTFRSLFTYIITTIMAVWHLLCEHLLSPHGIYAICFFYFFSSMRLFLINFYIFRIRFLFLYIRQLFCSCASISKHVESLTSFALNERDINWFTARCSVLVFFSS